MFKTKKLIARTNDNEIHESYLFRRIQHSPEEAGILLVVSDGPLSRIGGDLNLNAVDEVLGDGEVATSGDVHDDPGIGVADFLEAPLEVERS